MVKFRPLQIINRLKNFKLKKNKNPILKNTKNSFGKSPYNYVSNKINFKIPNNITKLHFCNDAKNLNVKTNPDEIHIYEGEVKDSKKIFEMAWTNVMKKHSEDNLNFPKEILFLSGAPGAGKGRMTNFIKDLRGIISDTIETSNLLNSKECKKIKSSGGLVSSRQVVELLIESLLQPSCKKGVIVDGFPRTLVQGECIKLLYDKILDLKKKYPKINRPKFSIMVLFVEEQISIERQLKRGKQIEEHNKRVKISGEGELIPIRKTDVSVDLAKKRYRQFKEHVVSSLNELKKHFYFHFIFAESEPEIVKKRIEKELDYQSKTMLHEKTFEKVRKVPLSTDFLKNARVNLVTRLDNYSEEYPELFDNVIKVINEEFIEIIKNNALGGKVVIRSQNPIYEKKLAVQMSLDILVERGYTVYLDKQKRIKTIIKNGKSDNVTYVVYKFTIQFPKAILRRGEDFLF